MPVLGAPVANRAMRFGKAPVGSEMDGGCDGSRRQPGTLNPVGSSKRRGDFCSHFDISIPIEIERHMTSGLFQASRPNEGPNFPARSRNESRQFTRVHAAADHCGIGGV